VLVLLLVYFRSDEDEYWTRVACSYVCSADTNCVGQLWKKNDKNSSLDDSMRFKYTNECYKAKKETTKDIHLSNRIDKHDFTFSIALEKQIILENSGNVTWSFFYRRKSILFFLTFTKWRFSFHYVTFVYLRFFSSNHYDIIK
jgi:hypothetical protein